MMQLPAEVDKAASAMLTALRETDILRRYRELREAVMADDVNRRLLSRFSRAQTALQMAAMAGSPPREEDQAEFERLSALLYQNDEVTDYLLSKMRAQQLVAAALERLTNEVELDVDVRES